MSRSLDLALLQFAPALGDVEANLARLADRAAEARAAAPDAWILTPELALTGYDLRERVEDVAVELDDDGARALGARLPHRVVLGLPELASDGRVFNTAAVFNDGALAHRHRKLYLPTYGMFDEMRYFARGDRLDTVELDGWRVGLLVCEDFWHPGLVYAHAAAGADAILVQSAGPGAGVWDGSADRPFASWITWVDIARVQARLYGVYIALCNRVGVEDGATFAGGSLVAAPDGSLLASAPALEEATLTVRLERDRLRAARLPASHLRDDDPAVVIRALEAARGSAG